MNNVVSLALRPIVTCSAPASRPLASSVNKSVQKSSNSRIQPPIILDFHSGKGKQEIKNWYNRQPTTKFNLIEYRKDKDGHFRHEFIVVRLEDGSICRFDRRARQDMRGHALKVEGTISEDSAHVITRADPEYQTYRPNSEGLLYIELPEKQDLKLILTVCFGTQSHREARSYSLLYYNCYFFSWTIFMLVARQTLKWGASMTPKGLWEAVTGSFLQRIKRILESPKPSSGHRVLSKLQSRIWILDLIPLDLSPRQPSPFESLLKGHIYRSTQKALTDYTPIIPANTIETALFKSQLSLVLRGRIASFLWMSSQVGAKQYAIDVINAYRNNKITSPFSQDSDVSSDRSLSDLDPTSWPSREKRIWRKAEEMATEIYGELVCEVRDVVEGFLPDVPSGSSSIARYNSSQKYTDPESANAHVRGYIRKRMVDHFEQVQSYGFGKAEELIDQAEKSMTEIWEFVAGMMNDESRVPFL